MPRYYSGRLALLNTRTIAAQAYLLLKARGLALGASTVAACFRLRLRGSDEKLVVGRFGGGPGTHCRLRDATRTVVGHDGRERCSEARSKRRHECRRERRFRLRLAGPCGTPLDRRACREGLGAESRRPSLDRAVEHAGSGGRADRGAGTRAGSCPGTGRGPRTGTGDHPASAARARAHSAQTRTPRFPRLIG
jgi:hypothetical protein